VTTPDPFPLLCSPTHGGLRRNVGCGLFFADVVTADARDALVERVPLVLRHELAWSRDFLYAGTADRFDKHFDNDDRARLSDEIDAWTRATHAAAPLAFVYMTDVPERDDYTAWAARSVSCVPDVVLPWVRSHWAARGPSGSAGIHAAVILDNLAYFIITLYAEKTPALSPGVVAELVHAADVIAASDSTCGADRWRDELLARLQR
jgi:hypothetical protein